LKNLQEPIICHI
ncbi:KAP family P-loop domain protein, partial [Haemophilus influenzae]